MYFTIWYGVYNKSTHELSYSVGGHPAAVLVRKGTNAYERLKTPGMIIGAMPEESPFKGATVVINPGDRLYLFSDGVFEVFNPEGDAMLDLDGFAKALIAPSAEGARKIDDTLHFVQDY